MHFEEYINYCFSYYKNPKSVKNFHEFLLHVCEEKNITLEEIYKEIELNYQELKKLGPIIYQEITANSDNFPFFECLSLEDKENISLSERNEEALKILDNFYRVNPNFNTDKINDLTFITLMKLASEFMLAENFSKAKEILKIIFSDKLSFPLFYQFCSTYIDIISNDYSGIFDKLNDPIYFEFYPLRDILYFLYELKKSSIECARIALTQIRNDSIHLFNLLAFRYFSKDEPIFNKELNLSYVRRFKRLVKYYNHPPKNDISNDTRNSYYDSACIYLVTILREVMQTFLYTSLSWEKLNNYLRNEIINKYNLDDVERMLMVGIDDFYHIQSKPYKSFLNIEKFLTFLRKSKVVIDKEVENEISNEELIRATENRIIKGLRVLKDEGLITIEKNNLFKVTDQFLILVDFYLQDMYINLYKLDSPFDDNNCRKDN